ncbi:CgeB family protein [Butyrivibrio sp. AE2015]|uniref:CgeB family protein n=1 Tax=Butyrivibrio sp. AE2015 TaxID=1280663 RepID=UPI0003B494B1|nr:glycosyltransferase [Butyrivibrio sp. AE2015]
MKILVVNPYSYIHSDIMEALTDMYGAGNVRELTYLFKGKDVYSNEEFASLFEQRFAEQQYDLVFSTNFYPIIATVCHEHQVPYIAWTYDTPMNVLPCEQMQYDTNFIFLFDRIEVQKYKRLGYDRFWHMPLGVNTVKYEKVSAQQKFSSNISFMGKLYKSSIGLIKTGLSGDLLQYIDKLVDTQSKILDKYIVDELITEPIIESINSEYRSIGYDLTVNKEQLSYAITEYVTYLDRISLLEVMGRRYDVHLYTYEAGETEKRLLKDVHIHGPLDYTSEMPALFKSSKINLNWSLRAAQSAIPLRALDILGCGGFLLSNAQPELEECFENGKEVVLFHSIDEAVDLAGYYLQHDEERQQIAAAGLKKVQNDFKYTDRLKKMISVAL